MTTEPAADGFARFAGLSDQSMRLDRGAALIAADGDERDAERCIAALDALAATAAPAVERAGDGVPRLRALVDYLSGDYGLRGNTDDYYDPRNSFIDAVIERRCGIPISLSVVYIEVGRRLGIDLAGVGFPGHFLVGCGDAPELFIDTFEPTLFLSRNDCDRLLRRMSGGSIDLRPEHLAAVSTRQILVRMLANLNLVHARRGEFDRAIEASSRILLLQPDDAGALRGRAMLHLRVHALRLAQKDLEAYLATNPGAQDFSNISELLAEVEQRLRMLN